MSEQEKLPESPIPLLAHQNQAFLNSPQGRQVRILSEFIAPDVTFDRHRIRHTMICFGSARTLPPDELAKRKAALDPNKAEDQAQLKRLARLEPMARYYDECRELSRRLSVWGKSRPEVYALCTGGGPGIMEAGSRGAYDAKSPNIGLNIQLPYEQHPNPYITPELNLQFRYFFIRKFWFLFKARCLVAFPGGWGTMDELFEALTLIQTHKIDPLPVLIFGESYWKSLVNWDLMVESAMIDPDDMKYVKFTDSVDEGFQWLAAEMERRAPQYEGQFEPLGHSFSGIL